MFHHECSKLLYFAVKRSKSRVTRTVPVTIRYDTIRYGIDYLALKSWRDGQLNLAHGPETKNKEKIKSKTAVAQKKRSRQRSVEAVRRGCLYSCECGLLQVGLFLAAKTTAVFAGSIGSSCRTGRCPSLPSNTVCRTDPMKASTSAWRRSVTWAPSSAARRLSRSQVSSNSDRWLTMQVWHWSCTSLNGIITGPPIHSRLVMLSGVCRRRSSSVTLHGGPVEFRPVRATPC